MILRPESASIPENGSERRRDIHRLILEFRHRLTEEGYEVPEESEGIVVLSGPPQIEDDRYIENSEENIARIQYAVALANEAIAHRAKKPPEKLTTDDIDVYAPLLILDGETEQLPAMREIAYETGYPRNKIRFINSGNRGVSNTKTQITELAGQAEYRNAKHLTFLSTSYHVPRITRTADNILPPTMEFDVVGVPFGKEKFNVHQKVRGEIKRILAYSEKGYFTRFTKEPAYPLAEFGNPPKSVELVITDKTVPIPRELIALYAQLREITDNSIAHGKNVPFNGPLANVDSFAIDKDNLVLHISRTDYFSYLAASYYFRNNQQENPICPLAVSATLLGVDGTIIFERRMNVTELEGKYHVFGGALKPGEQPKQAVANILNRKLGLDTNPNAITLIGACQENLQNIVEIFFSIQLNTQQEAAFNDKFCKSGLPGNRDIRSIRIDRNLREVEALFHETDLTDWNPSGFYNVLYALALQHGRTVTEIISIVDKLKKIMERKPFRYEYPIEHLLKK